MSNPSTKVTVPFIAWFIWGLGAFFYFSQYLLRVVPSVIVVDLIEIFDISARISGMLGGFFYLPYICMQVPIGALVDKYGTKRLLTIGAFACGISAFLFAQADNVLTLFVSRFLLGLFSSASFICTIKLARAYLPSSLFGFIVGITQTLGMLGAGLSGPISHVNERFGYPAIFICLGCVFLLLAILSFLFVRDPNSPTNQDAESNSAQDGLNWVALKNKYVWFNALYAGLVFAPVQALGEYWGPFFLSNVYDLSTTQSAWAKSMLFVGWVIGGPMAGMLSDKIGRRPIMIGSGILSLLLLSLLFVNLELSSLAVFILCFALGFFNTGLVAAYTASSEILDKASSGISLAICNMLSISIGAIFISVCGALLDLISSGATNQLNERIYTSQEVLLSFSPLLACGLVAVFFAFKMKETYVKV